jgi:hypothetical protein
MIHEHDVFMNHLGNIALIALGFFALSIVLGWYTAWSENRNAKKHDSL